MNIVDSSGWLAYFADEPNAKHFLVPLNDSAKLIVPTVTIYEVFKVILRESSENDALQAAIAMQKGTVVDLKTSLTPPSPGLPQPKSMMTSPGCISVVSLALMRNYSWTTEERGLR